MTGRLIAFNSDKKKYEYDSDLCLIITFAVNRRSVKFLRLIIIVLNYLR